MERSIKDEYNVYVLEVEVEVEASPTTTLLRLGANKIRAYFTIFTQSHVRITSSTLSLRANANANLEFAASF